MQQESRTPCCGGFRTRKENEYMVPGLPSRAGFNSGWVYDKFKVNSMKAAACHWSRHYFMAACLPTVIAHCCSGAGKKGVSTVQWIWFESVVLALSNFQGQCCAPDLNHEFSVAHRTSTMKSGSRNARRLCQKECQKICQKECQKIMSERMSKDLSERMSKDYYMSEKCQKRISKR